LKRASISFLEKLYWHNFPQRVDSMTSLTDDPHSEMKMLLEVLEAVYF